MSLSNIVAIHPIDMFYAVQGFIRGIGKALLETKWISTNHVVQVNVKLYWNQTPFIFVKLQDNYFTDQIFGFLLWALHQCRQLWQHENIMQAKLLAIMPPFVKTTQTQILLTNKSAPKLQHLPLINPLIKQNKITVNPLVSAQQCFLCRLNHSLWDSWKPRRV